MSGDEPIHRSLTKDKVVRSEELSERAGAHWIHGSWLQVHQDGTWNKFAAFKKKCEGKKKENGKAGKRFQESLVTQSKYM